MSDWNYTSCSKPFETELAAATYLRERDFAGLVLKRETGFTAVCPTYPDGFYPDAIVVDTIENSKGELSGSGRSRLNSCC